MLSWKEPSGQEKPMHPLLPQLGSETRLFFHRNGDQCMAEHFWHRYFWTIVQHVWTTACHWISSCYKQHPSQAGNWWMIASIFSKLGTKCGNMSKLVLNQAFSNESRLRGFTCCSLDILCAHSLRPFCFSFPFCFLETQFALVTGLRNCWVT